MPGRVGTQAWRRLVALAATAGAVVLTSVAATPTAAPRAQATVVRTAVVGVVPVVPLLSVRRIPDWIEREAAAASVARGLPALFRTGLGAAAASSCLQVSRAGVPVVAIHPDLEVTPASNLKLITATAVLDALGPATRITTTVRAAQPVQDGVLRGNLYFVGAGDPVLRTASYQETVGSVEPVGTPLAALAAELHAAGLRRVTGTVVGDESLFDAERGVATWKASYAEEGDVGALSALDVDDGYSTSPPYGDDADPPVAAAMDLAKALRMTGVAVGGPARAGRTPAASSVVASVTSPPLAAIVGQMLRASDDTEAEILTKLLGARLAGQGTTAAGVAEIRRVLIAHGIDVAGLTQLDGSGLDDGDRVTCSLLSSVLAATGTAGPIFAGLPIAGQTGTLAERLEGTPAAGRLHAKTGTLSGVSALSGFVLPAAGGGGPSILFSFVTDGIVGEAGVDESDAIGAALAGAHAWPPLADALP